MIDWVTGLLPCVHKRLKSGKLLSIDVDGTLEWEVNRKLSVRGSHESSIQMCSAMGSLDDGRATHLYVDGNPSKFLQGHNIVGSDDLNGLMWVLYGKICEALEIPIDLSSSQAMLAGQYDLKRIDINYMYNLNSLEDVRAFLYAIEFHAKTRHGRSSCKGGTKYFGQNSRRWSLKFYSKYEELLFRLKNKKDYHSVYDLLQSGIVEWSKDKVRLELVLRTLELKKLNLSYGYDWKLETPFNIFQDYLGKLEMTRNVTLTDDKLNFLPRCLKSSYLHWKQGVNLREMLPNNTFYRHRRALLTYGIDINSYCESIDKSNVIPLVRVLEAKPVELPAWMYEKGLIFNRNNFLKKVG